MQPEDRSQGLSEQRLLEIPIVKETIEGVWHLALSAFEDDTTRLPNAAALAAFAGRYDPSEAVFFIDLSGFKAINDVYGHLAGDAALFAAGDLLNRIAGRTGCRPFRKGGDEFVVVVPADRLAEILQAAEALRRIPFEHEGNSLSVAASIGYALGDEDLDLGELIERADQACMYAKHRGDGAPIPWGPDMEQDSQENVRARCPSCQATTSLIVAKSQRTQHALTRCANCYQPFSAAAASG